MIVHRLHLPARPAASGFSLIEVLLAVIVLSVGLLALAALQASLIRSSAESKDQSIALAIAQEELEAHKAFVTSANYTAINVPAAVTTTVGATAFTVTKTVARYVWTWDSSTDSGQFLDVGAANVAAADSTIAGLSSGTVSYFPGIEFKRVDVSVGWTDATGATREVELLGTVSATPPAASVQVMGGLADARKDPEVRIYDPAGEVGVIPIAVGTDDEGNEQSVASSDPKPEQYGSTGRVSTKFNVLTYYEDAAGFVVQKNIETALVSCACVSTASPRDQTPDEGPFSPSYWDGEQFTSPKPVSGKIRGHLNTAIDQDQRLCGLCCRDHRDSPVDPDPTDDVTRIAKFDPFRPSTDFNASGDHRHYRNTSRLQQPVSGDLTRRQDAGGYYDEACRLVRVDGLFRVTTDPRLENISVLNMSRLSGSPTLSDATKTAYQNFVTNYITSVWNTLNAGTSPKELEDYSGTSGDLAQSDPVALIGGQRHNLHARALLVDWISQEAEAKLDCIGDTVTPICQEELAPYRDLSVLQVFPFLTVNMTNIGEWNRSVNTPDSGTDPVVTYRNDAIPNDRSTAFVRGEVTAASIGSARVTVFSHRGPTGLTDQVPIDPEDAGIDADAFERPTSDCIDGTDPTTARSSAFCGHRNYTVSSAGAGVPFKARVVDQTGDINFPAGQFDVFVETATCARGDGSAGSDPTNVHACSIAPESTTSVTLSFTNYNRVIVDCGGQNWVPADPQDPNTLCTKRNQTDRAPVSVTVRDYKLCSVTSAATGVTFSAPSSVTNPSNHPEAEVSSVVITLSPNAASIRDVVAAAVFMEEAGTCP